MKVEDLALQHYAAEEHGSWQGAPQPAQPLPVLLSLQAFPCRATAQETMHTSISRR